MNAFSKYVLVPYNEYVKKISKHSSLLDPILQSNYPAIIKNNELMKQFHISERESEKRNKNDHVEERIDFQSSNHSISAKDLDFQPISTSTPEKANYTIRDDSMDHESFDESSTLKPEKDTFDSITNSKGQILDSDGNIIPNSNIVRVRKYLQSNDKRGPSGIKRALTSIARKPKKIVKIINPRAKKALESILEQNIKQSGGGIKLWHSLKKF